MQCLLITDLFCYLQKSIWGHVWSFEIVVCATGLMWDRGQLGGDDGSGCFQDNS